MVDLELRSSYTIRASLKEKCLRPCHKRLVKLRLVHQLSLMLKPQKAVLHLSPRLHKAASRIQIMENLRKGRLPHTELLERLDPKVHLEHEELVRASS